jgi:hypothetical protein
MIIFPIFFIILIFLNQDYQVIIIFLIIPFVVIVIIAMLTKFIYYLQLIL